MQAFFISKTRLLKKPKNYFIECEDPKLHQYAPVYLAGVSDLGHAQSALLTYVDGLRKTYTTDETSIKMRGHYLFTRMNLNQTEAIVATELAVFSVRLSEVDIDIPESRQQQ